MIDSNTTNTDRPAPLKVWNETNLLLTKGARLIDPCTDTTLRIVIPTFGRETAQKTIYILPKELWKYTYLATQERFMDKLKASNPDYTGNYLTLPDETEGVAYVRQACIDLLPKGKLWMIDDSMRSFAVPCISGKSGNPSTRKANLEDLLEMYHFIARILDTYAHGGSHSAGNVSGYFGYDVIEGYKATNCVFFRTDILEKEGFNMAELCDKYGEQVWLEDHNLLCHLSNKGYINAVTLNYLHNYANHKAGGNSVTRTINSHNRAIDILIAEYEHVSKGRKSEVKGVWLDDGSVPDEHRYLGSIRSKSMFLAACERNLLEDTL